jgi:hypothetical protein
MAKLKLAGYILRALYMQKPEREDVLFRARSFFVSTRAHDTSGAHETSSRSGPPPAPQVETDQIIDHLARTGRRQTGLSAHQRPCCYVDVPGGNTSSNAQAREMPTEEMCHTPLCIVCSAGTAPVHRTGCMTAACHLGPHQRACIAGQLSN